MKKIDIQWSSIDWKKQDVVLANELGLTRERIRQKRLEIISVLRNRHELQALLANRVENMKILQKKRTECVKERTEVMLGMGRARTGMGRGEPGATKRFSDLIEERRALRLRIKRLRHKINILRNYKETEALLTLTMEDLRSDYWHRPSDTKEIFDTLAGFNVENMTREEIVTALKCKGIERSFSWVSSALRGLNRECLRKKAVRKSKYAWGTVIRKNETPVSVEGGKLSLEQYQTWTDARCAEVLGVENPSVVTQWRKAQRILKRRVVAVAEKVPVAEGVMVE